MVRFYLNLKQTDDTKKWKTFEMPADTCYVRSLDLEVIAFQG